MPNGPLHIQREPEIPSNSYGYCGSIGGCLERAKSRAFSPKNGSWCKLTRKPKRSSASKGKCSETSGKSSQQSHLIPVHHVAEISTERREENLFRNKLLECVSRTPRGSGKQGRFHHLANEKPTHLPIRMESLLRSKKPRRKLAQTHWREAQTSPRDP